MRTKEVADSKGIWFRKIRSEFFMFGHDLGLNAVALDEHRSRDMTVYAVAPHLFFDDARLFATPADLLPDVMFVLTAGLHAFTAASIASGPFTPWHVPSRRGLQAPARRTREAFEVS